MNEKLTRLSGEREGYFFHLKIILLFIVAAICGCQDASTPVSVEKTRPVVRDIKTAVTELVAVDDTYETTGTARSESASNIAGRIMGVVTAIYVQEGDRVKAGQLLASIDDRELRQKVKGASMAMETAKAHKSMTETTWRRYGQLFAERALSQQEMDQVETQKKMAESEYERAKAAYEEALAYEGYAKIKAPLTGIITGKKIDRGSMAVPGQVLLTMEGETGLYIEAYADETLAGRLKRGMTATIAIPAENRRIQGRIRNIVPAVDPLSRTFLIKIGVPEGGLRSGIYARVQIPVGKKETLLVPKGAVVTKGQLTGVYVVAANGVVAYRLVKTGREYGDGRMEVLSGLAPNERIVIEGTQRAVDGGLIEKNQSK